MRSKCCTNATLVILTNSMKRMKAVMNHLNYLISTTPTVDPRELEEISCTKMCLDELDDWSERSGRRQDWSDKDTRTIKDCFKDFVSLPSTATIKGLFTQHQDLYAISQHEPWKRIHDKVKNILRKRKWLWGAWRVVVVEQKKKILKWARPGGGCGIKVKKKSSNGLVPVVVVE